MKPQTTLLLVGTNQKKQQEKLNQILSQFFPKTQKFNPNLVKLSGEIGIDQVRNFKLSLYQKPYSGKIQVGLVEIENITIEAQNALLKLIEEPPQTSQIVITINNLQKLLPTIVSRCQIIFTKDTQDFEVSSQEILDAVTISADNLAKKFNLASKIAKGEPEDWIKQQIIIFREVFLIQLGVLKNKDFEIGKIAKKFEIRETLKILMDLITCQNLLKLNVNSRLLLENLLLTI